MPKEMKVDKSSDDIGLKRKLAGATIAIWGLIGLGILSYELTVLLNGVEGASIAYFTLNTGIVFGGLGILFNVSMGYVMTIFLISMKIALDISSGDYIQLAIDLLLFLGIALNYLSNN